MNILSDRELLFDAYTAAEDGLVPEHLVPGADLWRTGDHAAAEAALLEYVVAHGLAGYLERKRAEHGVADLCPAWCVLEHEPVMLCLPGADDGRDHNGPAVRLGALYDDEPVVAVYVEQGGNAEGKHPAGVRIDAERAVAPAFTPAQARELAAVLLRLADEVETLA